MARDRVTRQQLIGKSLRRPGLSVYVLDADASGQFPGSYLGSLVGCTRLSAVSFGNQMHMNPLTPEHAKRILRHNKGFTEIEPWVEYAIAHNFQEVRGEQLVHCPDCGAEPGAVLAQFVYYSSLPRLRECAACGLIYSDVRIDPAVLSSHFEASYKDEQYFMSSRAAIFAELVELSAGFAPEAGQVLDVGGATGLLASKIAKRRSDLQVSLSDLSETACKRASETHQLTAFTASIADLEKHQKQYDLLLLVDVIYYEENIQALWRAVRQLLNPGGRLIIRVPNKLALIRLTQALKQFLHPKERMAMQSRLAFFNPEHQYIFSPQYLRGRLKGLGFEEIEFLPSAVLRKQHVPSTLYTGIDRCLRFAWRCSGKRMVLSPSFVVTARLAERRNG